MENKQPVEVARVCSTLGCGKPSTMQCPKCAQLKLEPSYFCSQDCFKNFWSIHKLAHKLEPKAEEKDNYKYTGPLRPGKISARLAVPDHIKKPDYAKTGVPNEEMQNRLNRVIEVHSPEEIEKIRESCLIARKALDLGSSYVKVGVTTDEIDKAVHQFIIDNNAYPSPLNYNGFRKSICTSINEVICHGIPDDRPLENGDIINLDISVYYKGFHADLNETFCVGNAADSNKFLVEETYRCLEKAISICKPGVLYREVGNVIGKHAEEKGLSVVRSYTGHGVGRFFHQAPNIPHYPNNKATGVMRAGHVFTIEPMINQGTWKDVTWKDNWTSVTADGQRSAQFEHTLLITEDGVEVLTARLPESPPLSFKL